MRGYSPNSFAGLVASSSTIRLSEMRPARTPNSWIICSRFSSPGPPFGIFEKSSLPRVFCPSKRNAQWSVEIADSASVRTAFQRTSQFDLSRTGGEKTYFAPSKSGFAMSSSEVKKYCVHVSPHTSQPFSRASAIGSTDSLHETWTTYSGAPATRAS